MSRVDEVFAPALKDKKIPVLTLDHKWHQLFTQKKPDKQIGKLEAELNELLKRQGKATTDIKKIKNLKKKLMDEIMEYADEASSGRDKGAEKKVEENRRLISECNEKIENYEDELIDIPSKINRINKILMLKTMEICYETLKKNKAEIDADNEWIERTRAELKERLKATQEKEQMNEKLYSYMHDIFGADVINIFDMEYLKKNKE